MQALLVQALFAPLVAIIASGALLLLWWYNRHIRYLPFFSLSLLCFALGVVCSQVLIERMTVPNAFASSMVFYASSGSMVHGALMRKGLKLNIPLHLAMMAFDITGRVLILHLDYSSIVYVVFANMMLGAPLAVGAYRLALLNDRDMQSTSIAFTFGFIAFCLIAVTPFAVFIGEQVSSENYLSSSYWLMLSVLTVIGILFLVLSFGFTMATDLLRKAKQRDEKITNTIHDIRQPLHALRLKMHSLMEQNERGEKGFEDITQTFSYLEELIARQLRDADEAEVLSFENENFRLNADDILNSVHEMFLADAEAKGLKLIYHPSRYDVEVDGVVLMRIASNLVSNAIKYTQEGEVEFGLREVDGVVQLEVHDTGFGMTREEFSAALDRNVRLEKGAQLAEGMGFGLAIIKELAEQHNLSLSLCTDNKSGTGVSVGF